MAYETAGTIINDAAIELGLAEVADPYASTDPNVKQLTRLLKRVGRNLLYRTGWTQFQREFTFTTVALQTDYNLPSDFRSMIEQSGWNRTSRLPLGGPLSPQEWQYLKARRVGVTFNVLFRPREGLISFFPDPPPSGMLIAYEYLSNGWVIRSSDGTTLADVPVAKDDIIRYEPPLPMLALKVAWLRAKGFDTAAAEAEYQDALNDAIGSNITAAPVLSIGGTRYRKALIDFTNVPASGYGGGSSDVISDGGGALDAPLDAPLAG